MGDEEKPGLDRTNTLNPRDSNYDARHNEYARGCSSS